MSRTVLYRTCLFTVVRCAVKNDSVKYTVIADCSSLSSAKNLADFMAKSDNWLNVIQIFYYGEPIYETQIPPIASSNDELNYM